MDLLLVFLCAFGSFSAYLLWYSRRKHKVFIKVRKQFNQGIISRQQAEDLVDVEHKCNFYLYYCTYGLPRKVILGDGKVHTLREECVGGIYMYLNQDGYVVNIDDVLMEK